MKIYFCGSIRGGRDDAALYQRLISKLKEYGPVLTEHVGDCTWTPEKAKSMSDKAIFEEDMAWLKECDVVVAEVTCTSMGVGFELGRALEWGKRILCLYRQPDDSKKCLSAMISGAHDGQNFIVKKYTEPEADAIFKEFLTGQ